MNTDELKRATKHLGGLFSGQVTQELAILIKKDWPMFEFKLTLEAIEAHKRATADNFLNYGKLLGEIRAAHKPRTMAPTDNSSPDETWCDMHRRLNEQLRTAGDFEVILRVHRGWWKACKERDSYRDKFRGDCRRLLIQSGMEEKAAAEWAESIFSDVDYFRLALGELRGDRGVFDHAEPAASRA